MRNKSFLICFSDKIVKIFSFCRENSQYLLIYYNRNILTRALWLILKELEEFKKKLTIDSNKNNYDNNNDNSSSYDNNVDEKVSNVVPILKILCTADQLRKFMLKRNKSNSLPKKKLLDKVGKFWKKHIYTKKRLMIFLVNFTECLKNCAIRYLLLTNLAWSSFKYFNVILNAYMLGILKIVSMRYVLNCHQRLILLLLLYVYF